MKYRGSLKVIAVYAGDRRQWADKNGAEESCKIVECWAHLLKTINYGSGMDVLFVNNEVDNKEDEGYKSFVLKLNSLINKKIKTGGKIMVEHRPNTGLMMGSYNYAFQKYKNDYDYFWFTEDDRFNVVEGSLTNGIEKIEKSKNTDNAVGFVCTQALITKLRGCRGCCGIVSSEILKEIFNEKGTHSEFVMETSSSYRGAERSEYRLTRAMGHYNYKLDHLDNEYGISIIWKNKGGYPYWDKYRKGWVAKILKYCETCVDDE